MVEVFGDADRDAPNILPTNDVVVDHGNGELVVAIAASSSRVSAPSCDALVEDFGELVDAVAS